VTVAEWDSVPLVPVTVTVYDPAVPLHESVEVPEPVKLVGVRAQVKPVAGLMLEVKLTMLANPSSAVTVIVEGPDAPARTVALVGLAVIVKSWTVKVAVAGCDKPPLVPVTVTVYTPAMPEHERVDVPEPVTLVGVRVQVSPVVGLMVEATFTIPPKPLRAVTVIVEVPAAPAFTDTVVGFAEMVKSWTR
jgi:hypothetical protein